MSSANYLAVSLIPSTTHSSPPSRKLLILDLNGTLLFRTPHPPQQRSKHKLQQHPRLRRVHPRPYMLALRAYLFAPQTLAWLDTMVWSSAQPHSVDDMVATCFGPDRALLRAVWARDTLGLSPAEYNHKTPTTKDLARAWAALPRAPAHSACTTLLLDDSPGKARLQPWNHLGVPAYNAVLRARDLAAQSAGAGRPGDETLLGVIGMLDALKRESNVAGWMRAGGPWGPAGADADGAHAVSADGVGEEGGARMWFEDSATVEYWAAKGRAVLDELGVVGAIDS